MHSNTNEQIQKKNEKKNATARVATDTYAILRTGDRVTKGAGAGEHHPQMAAMNGPDHAFKEKWNALGRETASAPTSQFDT